MRSIWRGAINFGMVTIPVKLYTATEQKDVRFHLVHKTDGARIVEKRFWRPSRRRSTRRRRAGTSQRGRAAENQVPPRAAGRGRPEAR